MASLGAKKIGARRTKNIPYWGKTQCRVMLEVLPCSFHANMQRCSHLSVYEPFLVPCFFFIYFHGGM